MADTIDAVDPPPPPPEETVVDTEPVIPVAEPPPPEGCMSKRSGLEKCLIVLVIIILVLAVAMIIAFLVYYFFASPPHPVCLTDGCVQSASRLKSRMDGSLDPCNSFYDYACQGWLQDQVLDPGVEKIDMETQMREDHLLKLKSILEQEVEIDEIEYSSKPKMFYMSCLDLEQLDKLDTQPFMDVVQSVGKFPALDANWNNSDYNLGDTLINLARMSIMPLFQFSVGKGLKDSSQNRLYLSDAKLGLDKKEYYIGERDSKMLSEYQQWMVNTLVLLGADVTDAEEDMENVVDFEIRLAKIMRDDSDKAKFKSSYKTMDADTLQVKYQSIPWRDFLRGIASTPDGSIGVYIGKEEVIINKEPKYFEKLGPLLNGTSKRVLANYLMSRLLPLTANLGTTFIAEMDEYNKNVQGKDSQQRWEYCALLTSEIFAESVSRMFVEDYFSRASKSFVSQVAEDILTVFKDEVVVNLWMTEETKAKALDKVASMKVKVGYPDYLYDDERLVNFYKDVAADDEDFMGNMISFRKFDATENMKQLRMSPDSTNWVVQATSLGVKYNPKRNEIVFPAAYLQEPIYSPEYPSSMSYGGIAGILGREMVHSVDMEGKEFDGKGDKKKWWKRKDEEGFKSHSACFKKQAGCYKWDGLSVDEETALVENIAYNGGLKNSYKAYLEMIDRKATEDQLLPGLKLNNHQVFFLNYAQIWCAKYKDEAKEDFLSTSDHPPFPYRVFGTLQNSEKFSEAFKCGVGTRMNPKTKCSMF